MSGEPWLILPTYNEAENIEAIVTAAGEVLAAGLPRAFACSSSTTARPTAPARSPSGSPRARLGGVLHRTEKNGIGPAYLAGLPPRARPRRGIRDGDGLRLLPRPRRSRPPAAGDPRGADLALGSRYVPGGGVRDWSLLRRFISEGGSTYARWVLGLSVRDLTGGFKCFRREVLEAIHFDSVRSRGYAFQVELTYRAVRAGFRVVEVPIVFRDRQRGQSKMSWRIAAEAMWLVPRLRFR